MIRDYVNVTVADPPIGAGNPQSTDHGPVGYELISRAVHTHTLYRDNNDVDYKLEEATIITDYADSIKIFHNAKDGRSAWLDVNI